MSPRQTVMCAKCQTPMNCHAEKPSEPRSAEEAERCTHGVGVMVEATYQCPRCGNVIARREA